MGRTRKAASGFTLIELMIVVAIVGILAVLGTYGVRKYLANAKTAEARNSLGQIAKDQAAEYERESMQSAVLAPGGAAALSRALCGSEPGNPIPALTSINGAKYQSDITDWNKGSGSATAKPSGFACLKFILDQPQYYAYSYTSSGTTGAAKDSFTATANGDLNGDKVYSTFSITGRINDSFVLNIAPGMGEVNAEE